jgi:acetyl esterase/lipase
MTRERLPITPEDGLRIFEIEIKAREGYQIRCRLYSQHDKTGLPLFIYMHGGGYVKGSLETDDRYCRILARELDVLILSIEYRLAPEYKFPIGFGDCFDVVKWVRSAFNI